jgi:hypothetical protein
MIQIIPNFIAINEIDEILKQTNFQEFTPVNYSPGVMTKVPYKPNNTNLFNQLKLLQYGNLSSVEMLLYKIGSHSPLHMDKASFDGGSMWSRTGILMCSDQYEGGELLFPKLNTKLKLPKGTFISFPAGENTEIYTHGVDKIISGERISLVVRYCR